MSVRGKTIFMVLQAFFVLMVFGSPLHRAVAMSEDQPVAEEVATLPTEEGTPVAMPAEEINPPPPALKPTLVSKKPLPSAPPPAVAPKALRRGVTTALPPTTPAPEPVPAPAAAKGNEELLMELVKLLQKSAPAAEVEAPEKLPTTTKKKVVAPPAEEQVEPAATPPAEEEVAIEVKKPVKKRKPTKKVAEEAPQEAPAEIPGAEVPVTKEVTPSQPPAKAGENLSTEELKTLVEELKKAQPVPKTEEMVTKTEEISQEKKAQETGTIEGLLGGGVGAALLSGLGIALLKKFSNSKMAEEAEAIVPGFRKNLERFTGSLESISKEGQKVLGGITKEQEKATKKILKYSKPVTEGKISAEEATKKLQKWSGRLEEKAALGTKLKEYTKLAAGQQQEAREEIKRQVQALKQKKEKYAPEPGKVSAVLQGETQEVSKKAEKLAATEKKLKELEELQKHMKLLKKTESMTRHIVE